jgi:hypothetical protein
MTKSAAQPKPLCEFLNPFLCNDFGQRSGLFEGARNPLFLETLEMGLHQMQMKKSSDQHGHREENFHESSFVCCKNVTDHFSTRLGG